MQQDILDTMHSLCPHTLSDNLRHHRRKPPSVPSLPNIPETACLSRYSTAPAVVTHIKGFLTLAKIVTESMDPNVTVPETMTGHKIRRAVRSAPSCIQNIGFE